MQVSLRRQLDVQRISVAEKYRPIYEKQARENLKQATSGDKKSDDYKKSVTVKLPQPIDNTKNRNPTTDNKLSKIADVMQWMISHQQARRNLSPGELIFANSMVAEEIAEENKKKQLEGTYKSHESRKNGSVHMDGSKNIESNQSHTSPTHTREQVAKLSGVGTGTVARYEY